MLGTGRIVLTVLTSVVSVIASFGVHAVGGTKSWYLLQPPVDETSNVTFGILNQAPLSQWTRIATYDTEAACEHGRQEGVEASREETRRLSKTSPLPSWRYSREPIVTAHSQTLVSASQQMPHD